MSLWSRFCFAVARHYDHKARRVMPCGYGSWEPYRKAADTADFWWRLGGGKGR